jgi:ferric-dicitrate binding protein FerR (iron transport regulator)
MEYTSDIDERIAKHLTGELSEAEQALLEKWVAASEENQQYFQQMERLWQHSILGRQGLSKEVDVEAALKRTKAKIQAPKAKVLQLNYWRFAAAAILLVLIGAIWFFQQHDQPQEVMLSAQENTLHDTLSDGSAIALNQHSSLSASFTQKSRRVKMTGEAYFEVAPNAEKPFVIAVQDVEVTVVGTKFNIDNRSDPNWIIVSVEEGKVQVKSGNQVEYLIAGEQARIEVKNGQFKRNQTKPSGNISAWANHQFVFDDVPLSEVIPLLEKNYQVKINLTNKDLANCRLYVRFNNEPIERIIPVIAETFSLKITQLNGQYFLDGAGCDR